MIGNFWGSFCVQRSTFKSSYNNKTAIQIAKNEVLHELTNHIEVDCHVIHYYFRDKGTISLSYISIFH